MYFGITSMKVEDRWKNGKGYETQYFYRAINKYGWDNIEHIVLVEGLTKEEACHYEEVLIAYFDTTNKDRGYNLMSGGECNIHSEESRKKMSESLKGRPGPMKGKTHSQETRRKLSESHKGYKHTEEQKRKISESSKGKKISEEQKRKISESKKGKHKGAENHRAKKIKCIELNIIFDCKADANEYLGKPRTRSNISTCLTGKTKTAFGYHWEYVD